MALRAGAASLGRVHDRLGHINMVDNFIKPWLIGIGIEMPMSLTILGVFGGFIAFGFLGLFIGSTLIAIMFTLRQAWRVAMSGHPAAEVMSAGSTAVREP